MKLASVAKDSTDQRAFKRLSGSRRWKERLGSAYLEKRTFHRILRKPAQAPRAVHIRMVPRQDRRRFTPPQQAQEA